MAQCSTSAVEKLDARQVAALPYRINADGSASVMLITSRDTRRWVIPKGNHMAGLAPAQAAAVEAFEEAGITGRLSPVTLGEFAYDKRRRNGRTRPTRVEVFPLAVGREASTWPEGHERIRHWFAVSDAVAAVDEPGLKAIIGAFDATPMLPSASQARRHPG